MDDGNDLAPPVPDYPVGVLVIRAWFDHGRLRARVRWTTDVVMRDSQKSTTDGRNELLHVVDHWLGELASPKVEKAGEYKPRAR